MWGAHFLAHLAWGKIVVSLGASVASISSGVAIAASSAFAVFWAFKVKILTSCQSTMLGHPSLMFLAILSFLVPVHYHGHFCQTRKGV